MARKALYRTSLAALGLVSVLVGGHVAVAADMPESWRPDAARQAIPVEDVCAKFAKIWLFQRTAWLRAHPQCAPATIASPWSSLDSKSSRPTPPVAPDKADPPAPDVHVPVPCNCAFPTPDVIDRLPPLPVFD